MTEITTVTTRKQNEARSTAPAQSKIFIRDYILDCYIGVFEEEKGVTQKVGFTIEAAVFDNVSSDRDDISDVPSYDDLTGAVDKTISAGHINLVETMAEHIAARILKDDRFVWVRVRVEKLDRGPAAVGIEIVRPRGCDATV